MTRVADGGGGGGGAIALLGVSGARLVRVRLGG